MKDYRANKVKADPMPEEAEEIEAVPEVEAKVKYIQKPHVEVNLALINPVYMSYYVTKGTEIHKKLLEYEKTLQAMS